MGSSAGALTRYLFTTFVVSWFFWVPVMLASYGLPSFTNGYVGTWFTDLVSGKGNTLSHWFVLFGGVLGPLAGAIAAWHHRAGKKGVITLFEHLIDVRISGLWGWLSAFLIPLVYFGIASAAVIGLSGVSFVIDGWPFTFILLFLVGCLLITGEELGWRGTQLPLHQENRSSLTSSFFVALTWSFWHLPLMLMGGASADDPGGSLIGALPFVLVIYPLMTIPAAILITTTFNTARGLILVPILFHSFHNALNADMSIQAATDAIKAQAEGMAGPILMLSLWVVAIAFILFFGRKRLSRCEKVTMQSMLGEKQASEQRPLRRRKQS